jgi:acyl-CoA reductase-like NAD-dependent aldehyde dehydrogenase
MKMLIGGKWAEAATSETFSRHSPGNGLEVGIYPEAGSEDVDRAVAAARSAFDAGHWAYMPAENRARILTRTAELIRQNADRIALLETLESGKVISQARAEMDWSANLWDYCAGVARTLHGDSHNNLGPNLIANVIRESIGVVSIITPWNFPLLIISQKLPFALAAGCTAVVKPSEFTPATTLILGELLLEAGLPEGVVNIVTGHGRPAGQRMLDHPGVDMISFTGSTRAGRRVAELASQSIKRVALELGGKSPNVLLDDADFPAAVKGGVAAAYANSGQTCNALTRMLVPRSRLAEVEQLARDAAESYTVGGPFADGTRLGPLISSIQRDRVRGYIEKGIEEGAVLVTGGAEAPDSLATGYFVKPTVFSNVTRDMTIAREEIFGPVLSIIPYDTEDEAVEIANDSLYGLSAAVSGGEERAQRVARKIRAGQVRVNAGRHFGGAPFGGYKQSGLGREHGRYGLEEFLEVKALFV